MTTEGKDPEIDQLRRQFALAESIERKQEQALGQARTLKRAIALRLIKNQHGNVTADELHALLARMGCE